MKFKKFIIMLCCFTTLNLYNVHGEEKTIHITINGKSVQFTDSTGYPYVDQNNRTMVPLRVTMEATGASVGYDTNKQTAIVVTEHDRIEIPVGTDYLYNNNTKIQNDTNSVINNGRVYLPIRAVLESADYNVEWDSNTQTVSIYNFTFDKTTFVPYSTTDPLTLVNEVIKGNVIYVNGGYYATPKYLEMYSNTEVHYSGSDLNIAIYPQNDRYALSR